MIDDMRAWLAGLGLAKYGDAFADHDIGPDILADLTRDDLKELGLSIGNQLRLLKAIRAEYGAPQMAVPPIDAPPSLPHDAADATANSTAEDAATATDQPTAQPSDNVERRPLTVMFCDLADSTALSTRLDPEDLQDVIRAYQEACAERIREFGGYIAKYMGDGILVYFGYPKTLERDAERAVRSALSIVQAMAGLNQTIGQDQDIEIAVRIGIATGTVMVGEVIGEGMAQERTVVGEAPNMAARLQGLAGRNGIVIGTLTKDLTGDGFLYRDRGSTELKGITGLVQTWEVAGLRDDGADEAGGDDFDSDAAVPELVGRDEEIGLLRRAWQSVKEEERGQVVTVSGEAGIGKGVLIDGLRAAVRAEGKMQLVLRSSPYHTNSALYPVIEYFKRLARWQPEDTAETRLGKLETLLESYEQPTGETVPLIAEMLTLALPEDRYPPHNLTPKQQKQRTQDALIEMILETAERQPLLQLWEDLHWADPSTLEFIGLLIDQAPTAALLIVVTARPDFITPWQARSHITPITLNRLESQHAAALVARLAGMKPLPGEVVDHIVAKADGVPLYVEELSKTILASDVLRDAGTHFELTGPLSSLAIPDTLQESLMARLDRLPLVREIAQLGSVLGREFAYEMISGLSAGDDGALQEGLGQLVDAELLYQRGRPPRAKYIFKHALVQDAAYSSLLRRTRQSHHLQVARLLESSFPDIVESNPELVAHHYSEANEGELAIDFFYTAGARSLRISANKEAIAHLAKGLEVLGALPPGPDRAQRELKLLMPMGPALIAIKGYASADVEPALRRALELCREVGDTEKEFSVLQGLSLFHLLRGDLLVTRRLSEQLVDLARGDQEPGADLAALRSLGYATTFLGELEVARSCLDQVTAEYNDAIHGDYARRLGGANFGVGSYSIGGWLYYVLGYSDQALAQSMQGLALAKNLDHPLSEAAGLWCLGLTCLFRGEPEAVLENAGALAEISRERDLVQYAAWAMILSGWAHFELGDRSAGIAEIRQGIDDCRALGSYLITAGGLKLLAEVLGRNGQPEAGLEITAEAITEMERMEDRFWEAELHRLQGQLLLESDSANAAQSEACFQQAIKVARAQNAKSWELRAATSLARLWHGQKKTDEARDLLAPVYNWFTEGFDAADLKDAKNLLDELG